MTVKTRQKMEKMIQVALMFAAIQKGLIVEIDNGEDNPKEHRLHPGEKIDKEAVEKFFDEHCMQCDEESINMRNADNKRVAWFFMVYGNSGYDVISDYSVNEISEELYEVADEVATKLETGNFDIAV
jgi:hypothetical protein